LNKLRNSKSPDIRPLRIFALSLFLIAASVSWPGTLQAQNRTAAQVATELIRDMGLKVTPAANASPEYAAMIEQHMEKFDMTGQIADLMTSIHSQRELVLWQKMFKDPVGRSLLQKLSGQTMPQLFQLIQQETRRAIKCTPLNVRTEGDRAVGTFTPEERRTNC